MSHAVSFSNLGKGRILGNWKNSSVRGENPRAIRENSFEVKRKFSFFKEKLVRILRFYLLWLDWRDLSSLNNCLFPAKEGLSSNIGEDPGHPPPRTRVFQNHTFALRDREGSNLSTGRSNRYDTHSNLPSNFRIKIHTYPGGRNEWGSPRPGGY